MKFMHMADVHLGAAPDAGTDWSQTRKDEIWETFRSCLQDARHEQVDLLLIAGDLFHRQPSVEELREVDYLFSGLYQTRVVLIAGNHDCLSSTNPYLDFPWSRNVVFLTSRECECVRFPEIQTEVYGLSYDRAEIPQPLYDDLHPARNEYFHILLAHGGDSRHIPLSKEKLAASGFDYIALGHIHKPGSLLKKKACYPGAPEPIDCLDTGRHGYLLGETNGRHVSLAFVPKARREYRTITLACTEEDSTFSLRDRLEKEIEQQGWQHIYRVTLEGYRRAGTHYETRRLREYGMVLDIEDRTKPQLHLDELRHLYRGRLIGRYIDSFDGQNLSETEEKALQYGLEALLEEMPV